MLTVNAQWSDTEHIETDVYGSHLANAVDADCMNEWVNEWLNQLTQQLPWQIKKIKKNERWQEKKKPKRDIPSSRKWKRKKQTINYSLLLMTLYLCQDSWFKTGPNQAT